MGTSADLFDALVADVPAREPLGEGAVILRQFALAQADALLAEVRAIVVEAPFRHLVTPGGQTMSVAMTNCGDVGWVSDRRGYRYEACDPQSGRRWPAFPPRFLDLAARAGREAGFPGFRPDACLINRYEAGTRLSMHRDFDEGDRTQPIVSVSLGIPAVFQFGGLTRDVRPTRHRLVHGDVVVFGGPSRLAYHGVAPIKDDEHPATGRQRINLTFRKAL